MAETQPKQNSPWFDTVPDTLRRKPLRSHIRADVTVIGAGMVGVLAAWNLAKAGKNVVLLEKNHVATGETGYSTAFVTRIPDVRSLAETAKQYGIGFLQDLVAANQIMQRELFSLVEKERLDCDFRLCSSYYFSSKEHDETLDRDWEVIKQIELSAERVGDTVSAVFPLAKAAVLFPDEARFDVRKFLFGLLETETGKNIRVFEESPAVSLDADDRTVHVKTDNGGVRSASVILASGSPAELLPETKELFSPVTTHVVLAQCRERLPFADALLWDTEHPYHYLRRVDEQTVMLGGEDHPAQKRHKREKRFAALERYLRETLAGNFSITHAWTGTLYDTTDELPYATEHPHYPGKMFFVSGLGGNGIVMGSLAGTVAAAWALGEPHPAARLLSLDRTKTILPQPKATKFVPKTSEPRTTASQPWLRGMTLRVIYNVPPRLDGTPRGVSHSGRRGFPLVRGDERRRQSPLIWKGFFPILWIVLFLLPAYSFFHLRGGIGFLSGLDITTLSFVLFPLVGLYAFFFVWAQVMIGANRDWLHKLFPGILRFHRMQGMFTLLFALLHPTLLFIGVGPAAYFAKTYVPQSLHLFIWLGYVQLSLLILTAGTALLMRVAWIGRHWRWIHCANYFVFIAVWIHSWFLGSDVQATNLRYLWYFSAGTFALSALGRIARGWRPRKTLEGTDGTLPEGFVTVGPVDSFPPHEPQCVDVNGKKIVLVNDNGTFYALDTVCSHAGGPLCEGALENGTVIVCPWHASRFDIKSGAVINGPARKPQQRYDVRVHDETVFVRSEPEKL